jgi:hypothetical protein
VLVSKNLFSNTSTFVATFHSQLQSTTTLPKQGLAAAAAIATPQRRAMVVQPLIPGYTIPMGDGVLLFAAALAALVVHEAGHACAAIGDGIR